jgi:hypothetical protein
MKGMSTINENNMSNTSSHVEQDKQIAASKLQNRKNLLERFFSDNPSR